jgi:hypothetical protein
MPIGKTCPCEIPAAVNPYCTESDELCSDTGLNRIEEDTRVLYDPKDILLESV